MAEITAALVKALREKTGAGMMDCKSALVECCGDMEAAVDWLRKKGLAAAAKKAGRAAKEGLVGVVTEGARGALVEVNSETDFVARNDIFQSAVATITGLALEAEGDFEALKAAPYPGGSETVAEAVTSLIATIGENIGLRRAAGLRRESGVVASYMHGAIGANLGREEALVVVPMTCDVQVDAVRVQQGLDEVRHRLLRPLGLALAPATKLIWAGVLAGFRLPTLCRTRPIILAGLSRLPARLVCHVQGAAVLRLSASVPLRRSLGVLGEATGTEEGEMREGHDLRAEQQVSEGHCREQQ